MKTNRSQQARTKSYWERETCEACGGSAIRDAVVEVYRRRGSRRFLFEGVPAGVCADCGARYFAGHAARMMEERMRHAAESRPRKTVTLPVLSLS